MERAARKDEFGLIAKFLKKRVEEDAFVRLVAIALRDGHVRLGEACQREVEEIRTGGADGLRHVVPRTFDQIIF